MRILDRSDASGAMKALLAGLVALSLSGGLQAQTPARVDDSKSAQQLTKLKRTPGEKVVVAIYDFRSAVPEVQVGAAREMFVTALIRSGTFAVAERARLAEGVMLERQLGASGVTSGAATGQLAAARYIFEVVVSEANVGASSTGGRLDVGGMQAQGAKAADQIGMDVRIVDTQSGLVVDAVNVVKDIEASTAGVSGVGNLLSMLSAQRGRNMPVPVNADVNTSRKEGVDRALRSCIEVAVVDLAKRFSTE
ncbi:MAG TPA: CsgG/HfaB family protein [Burkholderiaceae bacterium]|nr:CsgG/HfaB family protein [Burkholderiaceae bacterium]